MSDFSIKTLLGRGLAFTLLRVLALGSSAIGSFWVARHLGPEKLGISGWVLAWITPLTLLTQFALSPLVIREYRVATDKGAYAGQIMAQRAIFTFFWVILVGILYFTGIVPAGYELAMGSGIVLYISQQLSPAWIFQAEERMSAFFAATLLPGVAISAGYLLAIRDSSSAGSDVLIQAIVTALVLPLVWRYVALGCGTMKIPGVISALKSSFALFQRGRWMFFSGVTIYAYTTIEVPLVGWFSGVDSLGRYRSAIMVAGVVTAILGIFQQMLFPRFVAWREESPLRLWTEVIKIFRLSLIVLTPLCFFGGFLLLWIYPLVFGDEFSEAAVPALILCLSKVTVFLNGLFGWALWADQDNDKTMALIMLFVAIFSVFVNILTIPYLGMIAAAAINLVSEVLILINVYFFARRRYRLEDF